jgi:pimeloyl-ACP methyl ester carboxylesterase
VLKRIPDSYHFIMLDQPEAFQSELRTFLAK